MHQKKCSGSISPFGDDRLESSLQAVPKARVSLPMPHRVCSCQQDSFCLLLVLMLMLFNLALVLADVDLSSWEFFLVRFLLGSILRWLWFPRCAAPEDVHLLGFLMRKGTNAKSVQSSLRFAASRAECPVLLAAIDQPVVSGFAKLSQLSSEVRNATPLQMSFARFLEGFALDPLEPLGTRLVAGAILAASWASLRFSDLQRSVPMSARPF